MTSADIIGRLEHVLEELLPLRLLAEPMAVAALCESAWIHLARARAQAYDLLEEDLREEDRGA